MGWEWRIFLPLTQETPSIQGTHREPEIRTDLYLPCGSCIGVKYRNTPYEGESNTVEVKLRTAVGGQRKRNGKMRKKGSGWEKWKKIVISDEWNEEEISRALLPYCPLPEELGTHSDEKIPNEIHLEQITAAILRNLASPYAVQLEKRRIKHVWGFSVCEETDIMATVLNRSTREILSETQWRSFCVEGRGRRLDSSVDRVVEMLCGVEHVTQGYPSFIQSLVEQANQTLTEQ